MTTQPNPPNLDYEFRDAELLARALTHSSYANEAGETNRLRDNEQFEFLGDAVLSLVTSEHLWRSFPSYSEGELSKLRAHLVSARHLAKVARSLRIGDRMRLGRGEERTGGRNKQAILADALEAIIAAIYLDGGVESARAFITSRILAPELDRIGSDPAALTARTDHKSTLQEVLQAGGHPQPAYSVVDQRGPEHSKMFTVQVTLDSGVQVQATGRSKKLAEQRAAELALQQLGRPIPQVKP
ncbi:MAG: ribonuclease III [Acidobacteriales bacterium]|nr:ribonuclease III [Terriglobales bacterium]